MATHDGNISYQAIQPWHLVNNNDQVANRLLQWYIYNITIICLQQQNVRELSSQIHIKT